MNPRTSRRAFLQAAPLSLVGAGLVGDRFLLGEEAPRVITGSGRDLESLIGLIMDTPQDRRVAVVVGELRKGLSYRDLLAGLYLAAVRIESTHPVAMVHAANWVAAALPARDVFVPLFFVLNKIGGGIDAARKNNEIVPRTDKAPPPPGKALDLYHAAMKAKDPEAGELAALALARSVGLRQTMELVWQYACRDGDDLGHKAIRLSNSWRTLDAIGWEHAETPLRYLVARNVRAETDDATYEATHLRAGETLPKLPPDWAATDADDKATLDLYEELRAARTAAAVRLACEQLGGGKVKAGSVWDAVHLAAVELSARFDTREDLRGWPVHAVTSTNALHFAFRTVMEPRTRLLVLLQAVCWVSEKMTGLSIQRKRLRDLRITKLDPADVAADPAKAAVGVFELLPAKGAKVAPADKLDRDKDDRACRGALALVKTAAGRRTFGAAALLHLNAKANNSHDYKYAAAAFEDVALVSERWRPAFLAATVNVLHGPASEDAPVFREAREALAKL
jgi:hypothetical protein